MVNQYTSLLSPVAVDAVLKIIDPATAVNADLRDIRVVTRLGGTVDDTELVRPFSLSLVVRCGCLGSCFRGCPCSHVRW